MGWTHEIVAYALLREARTQTKRMPLAYESAAEARAVLAEPTAR